MYMYVYVGMYMYMYIYRSMYMYMYMYMCMYMYMLYVHVYVATLRQGHVSVSLQAIQSDPKLREIARRLRDDFVACASEFVSGEAMKLC